MLRNIIQYKHIYVVIYVYIQLCRQPHTPPLPKSLWGGPEPLPSDATPPPPLLSPCNAISLSAARIPSQGLLRMADSDSFLQEALSVRPTEPQWVTAAAVGPGAVRGAEGEGHDLWEREDLYRAHIYIVIHIKLLMYDIIYFMY